MKLEARDTDAYHRPCAGQFSPCASRDDASRVEFKGFEQESRLERAIMSDIRRENESMQTELRETIRHTETSDAEVLRLMRRNHRLAAIHARLFRDTRAQMRRVARLEAVVRYLVNRFADVIVIDDAALHFLDGLSVEVPEDDFFDYRDAAIERFISLCGRLAASFSMGIVSDRDLHSIDEAAARSLALRRLYSSSVGDIPEPSAGAE